MRSAWFGTTALLALAFLAVIAPTSAEAGCARHAVAEARGLAFAGLNELLDLETHAEHGLPSPVDAPAPCSGAFCSGSPAVPPAPLVAPIESPTSWAILIDRPDAHELSSLPLPFDESRFLPTFHGLSVFHPPRSVGSASL